MYLITSVKISYKFEIIENRFRRETAPTNEEIARRILMDKIRIENAIKLEKQQQSLKKVDPKLLPKNTNGFTSFPDYKDEYRK